MMVAIENERSRFNSAMGLASQGFSDVCELPLAVPVEGDRREPHRRVRRPPQPPLHRRLRDARLGRGLRGRAAGGLAAVGRGHRRGARRARLPRADHDPALAEQDAQPGATTRGVRRPVAARAAADRARRRRRRRARRQRLDRDAAGAGDAAADRARGVRAARGLRRVVRRDRGRRRQVGGRRAPDRAPCPVARRGPPAARAGRAGGRTMPCWSASSTPSTAATSSR